DHLDLASALEGYANSSHRTCKEPFLRILAAIRSVYFPSLELRSLVFLLGMVNNQVDWFKIATMQILCIIVPDIDMRKPEIASQGPDLISPLLRLLPTEHCQQALEVLDNVIEMTGTPLDNKHLRMSMAGSHSSRATRKEYESTQSLYGIPEESGWSIPMPAIHSAQTRSNVHAVFYTLAYTSLSGVQEETTTPDIEFHRDDYQYDSYFYERTATMMSDETRADGNMGELAEKLEDLDDFFDDTPREMSSDQPDSALRNSGGHEEREEIYDEQVVPILHHSLQRNAS
ncbi:Cell morphogenesis protein PAG1, partial [Teratosphaeriaceae sp. CCFEE 6253]